MRETGSHLFNYFCNTHWAMRPDTLSILKDMALSYIRGDIRGGSVNPTTAEVRNPIIQDGVAILPIDGVLLNKANSLDAECGFASTQHLRAQFNALVELKHINRIVLDIESPGGSVVGIPEFAEDIYNARSVKETVAFTNGNMCSAAYWLGSACEVIVSEGSACIGSIGTYSIVSKNKEPQNDIYIFQAGSKKLYGSPDIAMTTEEAEFFAKGVQQVNEKFLATIARNRGVDIEMVRGLEAEYFYADNAPEWLFDDKGTFNHALS